MKDKKRKQKETEREQFESSDNVVDKADEALCNEAGCAKCDEAKEQDDKDKRIDELNDKWRRTLAEFDNFRKRTMKEKASMYDDGVRDTIQKLLPVIDNFERALNSASDKESSLYKGLDMIAKQLDGYLKDMGVEEIPAIGECFDPNIHFAVTHIEDDSLGENEVSEVLQNGYKHKDKVIRPAMVKVAN